MVISDTTSVTPAVLPPSVVTSDPTSVMSRSMRGNVDAIVTSRTGSASAPSRRKTLSPKVSPAPVVRPKSVLKSLAFDEYHGSAHPMRFLYP